MAKNLEKKKSKCQKINEIRITRITNAIWKKVMRKLDHFNMLPFSSFSFQRCNLNSILSFQISSFSSLSPFLDKFIHSTCKEHWRTCRERDSAAIKDKFFFEFTRGGGKKTREAKVITRIIHLKV